MSSILSIQFVIGGNPFFFFEATWGCVNGSEHISGILICPCVEDRKIINNELLSKRSRV